MHFAEKGHEVIEGHGLEMFTLKFNPINETDILNAVKSTFDDLVSRDVFIVGEPPAGPLPVYTGLRSWVTGTHIGGLELDSCSTMARVAELNFKNTDGIVQVGIMRGGEESEEEESEEPIVHSRRSDFGVSGDRGEETAGGDGHLNHLALE